MATVRNGRNVLARPPGKTLGCHLGRTRPASIPSGCNRQIEIVIDSAGANPGDFIRLGITLKRSCAFLQNPNNEIVNGGVASCVGEDWFQYTIPDPAVWDPAVLPSVFSDVLMASPRLLNSVYLEFVEDENKVILTGREPSTCFDISDYSEGFAITVTTIEEGEPSATVPAGSAVALDACGFAHLLGSTGYDQPGQFIGFTVLCQDRYAYCGNDLELINHHHSGDDIEVLVAADSISVIPANLPQAESDVPVFDPSAPIGSVSFVPYGAPIPAGGYALEGWELESYSTNPSEAILTHC